MRNFFASSLNQFDRKNNRIKLSLAQINLLIEIFESNQKPTAHDREEIGRRIGIPADKVKNWFQNQRAKVRSDIKEQLFWNKQLQNVVKQVSKVRVYPGCNNFYQPRDFNMDESSESS